MKTEVNEIRIKSNIEINFQKLSELDIKIENIDKLLNIINEIRKRIEESDQKNLKYKNTYTYSTDLSGNAARNKTAHAELIINDNNFRFTSSYNTFSYQSRLISISHEKTNNKESVIIYKEGKMYNIFVDNEKNIKILAKNNNINTLEDKLTVYINKDLILNYCTKIENEKFLSKEYITTLNKREIIFKGVNISKDIDNKPRDIKSYEKCKEFTISPNSKNIIESVRVTEDFNINNAVFKMKTFFDYLRYNNGKITIENSNYKKNDFPSCKGKTLEEADEVIKEYQDVKMLQNDNANKLVGVITSNHFMLAYNSTKEVFEYCSKNTEILKEALNKTLIFITQEAKNIEYKNLYEGNISDIEKNLDVENLIKIYNELKSSFDKHFENKQSNKLKI